MKVMKKVFKTIYSFDVMEEIKKGNEVFILDRAACEVYDTSEITVTDFVRAISSKDEDNRYAFWIVEEVEVSGGKK